MERQAGYKLYRTLFSSTFYLSAFTFGGGYVIVPLIKKKFVEELGWIEEEEMLNLVAIGQSAPGPIAVNTSLLAGYRMAGVPGALITLLGTVTPPLIIISVIATFYAFFRDNAVVGALFKGMQAGVAAVIAEVVLKMGSDIIKKRDAVSILIMLAAFFAIYFLKINVMLLILLCGTFGAARFFYRRGKERTK